MIVEDHLKMSVLGTTATTTAGPGVSPSIDAPPPPPASSPTFEVVFYDVVKLYTLHITLLLLLKLTQFEYSICINYMPIPSIAFFI